LASEIPADEKTFAFALAQSAEFGAELIILHAIETTAPASSSTSEIHNSVCAGTASADTHFLESLAQRARDFGVRCEVVVRTGSAADQILTFLRERKIDRIVMGNRSSGPIGKMLVGSVAEAVIRNANVPVCVVSPDVVASGYRNSSTRNILCDVSTEEGRGVVASFGAEMAASHHDRLILQDIIRPQEKENILAGLTIDQVEAELPSLVPTDLQEKINIRTKVALGDPTEELLYGSRALNASFIVLGAQGASHFAAITRAGILYKVLAFAHCPVIMLSPDALNQLDGNYPYPSSYDTGQSQTPPVTPPAPSYAATDTPSMANLSNGVGEVGKSFDATMYVFWDPMIPPAGQTSCTPSSVNTSESPYTVIPSNCSSIPVPLGAIDWTWSACSINSFTSLGPGIYTSDWTVQCGVGTQTAYENSTYPTWTSCAPSNNGACQ